MDINPRRTEKTSNVGIIASQIAQNNPLQKNNYVRMPSSFKREQHIAADKFIAENKYKPNGKLLFKELVSRCDENGRYSGSNQTLANVTYLSLSTIQRWLARFSKDMGIRINEEPGWQTINSIDVLVIQHLNINKCVKMTNYISSPSYTLKDPEYITNYNEYVTLSANSESISKPKSKPKYLPAKPKSKLASISALNGNDPDAEVIRVCALWMLCEKKTKYAVMRMRRRSDIGCPARFLSTMAKRLFEGNWLMTDEESTKAESRTMPSFEKEALEIRLDELALQLAKDKLKSENVTFEVFDINAADFRHYEWLQGQYKLKILRELRIKHGLCQVH